MPVDAAPVPVPIQRKRKREESKEDEGPKTKRAPVGPEYTQAKRSNVYVCAACKAEKAKDAYSKTQFLVGPKRKCRDCVVPNARPPPKAAAAVPKAATKQEEPAKKEKKEKKERARTLE
jgi:hypothetical protein